MESGRVEIARNSERDIKMRDLYVLVDDQPERNLPFGRSLTLELDPGSHRIRVTNRMYSDEAQFSLQAGEAAQFQVANITTKGLLSAVAMSVGQLVYKPSIRRM